MNREVTTCNQYFIFQRTSLAVLISNGRFRNGTKHSLHTRCQRILKCTREEQREKQRSFRSKWFGENFQLCTPAVMHQLISNRQDGSLILLGRSPCMQKNRSASASREKKEKRTSTAGRALVGRSSANAYKCTKSFGLKFSKGSENAGRNFDLARNSHSKLAANVLWINDGVANSLVGNHLLPPVDP